MLLHNARNEGIFDEDHVQSVHLEWLNMDNVNVDICFVVVDNCRNIAFAKLFNHMQSRVPSGMIEYIL